MEHHLQRGRSTVERQERWRLASGDAVSPENLWIKPRSSVSQSQLTVRMEFCVRSERSNLLFESCSRGRRKSLLPGVFLGSRISLSTSLGYYRLPKICIHRYPSIKTENGTLFNVLLQLEVGFYMTPYLLF